MPYFGIVCILPQRGSVSKPRGWPRFCSRPWEVTPRRSRKITHLRSDKVTHAENTIWNKIQNVIRNKSQHHPRRRRATLAPRQILGYLPRKKTSVMSKSPLNSIRRVWRAPNWRCSLYGSTLTREFSILGLVDHFCRAQGGYFFPSAEG
jgi:hypothetical protein